MPGWRWLIIGALLLGGCKSKPQWQGRGDVLAVYQYTTLTAEFPDQVAVPAVVAAAETALRARGYAVTRSETTRDRGLVQGRAPNPGFTEKVAINTRLSKLGTRVEVRVDPFGSEAQARAILDDMLNRLGY